MARQVKRNVIREGAGGRQAIVRAYNARAWYELPDWAIDWLVDNAGWVVLVWALFLAPASVLAVVLGAHSLPLEYFGIPASNNGIGLPAVILVINFLLLVMAVRPLRHQRRRGLILVAVAAIVHFVDSIVLQHAITGGLLTLVVCYLYWQLRPYYEQ